jgi:hypothetical protein
MPQKIIIFHDFKLLFSVPLGKVKKVKLSLCLIKLKALKTYEGVEV